MTIKKQTVRKEKYFKSDVVIPAKSKAAAEKTAASMENTHDVLVGKPKYLPSKSVQKIVTSKGMRRITPKTPRLR